jgi:hypothetical protein
MLDVRAVTTGAIHGSGRWALDAAARKLAGVPADVKEIEKSLAREMASAGVSQGGTGPAMIGPGTAGPLASDNFLRRVQNWPRTVLA